MHPNVITTTEQLNTFCSDLAAAQWIALDTEFMRESTYYPNLCLLQIASDTVASCIDVIELTDIEPLLCILRDPTKVKIVHSARQDLEVLYASYNLSIEPLFDTQIAASILGMEAQVSYGALVEQIDGTQLSKTQSRTDWQRRPLTAAQIEYALDDVHYLGTLYTQLKSQLEAVGREQWLTEECQQLATADTFVTDPNQAWKSLKGVGSVERRYLPCIQQLAAWREKRAQKSNRPRRWLLPDLNLIEICQMDPNKIAQYLQAEVPSAKSKENEIRAQLQLVDASTASQPEFEIMPQRLAREDQDKVKKLMQHVKATAEEIGTSSTLLANRKSIDRLVMGKTSKVEQGWRKVVVGDALQHQLAALNSETEETQIK
ncbi:ribonuclease D [Gammaproteobacteria bacterium]|jgi:ribonuclease D|nr:ribonuclease D [Gammaproteobacteria bacterium]